MRDFVSLREGVCGSGAIRQNKIHTIFIIYAEFIRTFLLSLWCTKFRNCMNQKIFSGQWGNRQESGDSSALRQLLTHVPDIVINCDHKKAMPRVKHMVGVCMFADISGE